MTLKETLFNLLDNKKERMLEIRRYLHQHPELSFHEDSMMVCEKSLGEIVLNRMA